MKTDLAKLTIPSISRVLQRPRLFRLVDQIRKTNQIVWLSGCPGSGKTTLAAGYLSHKKLRGLWYRVDEGDGDLASFFHYLGMAATQTQRQKKKPLPNFTPEYLPDGISTFTRRFFRELFKNQTVPLVLDNYHEVPPDSMFHRVIREGLEEMPTGCFAIIISRTPPPQEFTRLQVSHQLGILDDEELKLTLVEARKVANLQNPRLISTHVLGELHQKTQGWIAGFILFLDYCNRQKRSLPDPSKWEQESIFNYLAEELFLKLDMRTQQFLLKSAYVPSITPQFGTELTGIARADQILESLHHNNFFTERRTLHRILTYKYHDLFRAFLLEQAKVVLKPDVIRRIQCRAAALLGENGQFEPAMELCLQAKAWTVLSQLLQQAGPTFLEQGRFQRINEWLNQVPTQELHKNPWLLYWSGMAGQSLDPRRSLEKFEGAFKGFQNKKDVVGMYAALIGGLTAIFHEARDFSQFDRWLVRLERLPTPQSISLPPALEHYLIPCVFWAMFFRKPDHAQLGMWHEQTCSLFETSQQEELRILCAQFLASYYAWMGELPHAAKIVDSLRRMTASRLPSPLTLIPWRIGQCLVAILSTEYENALTASAEGLEISKDSGVSLWEAQLHGMDTANRLSAGEFRDARECLVKMAAALNQRPSKLDQSFYHAMAGWEALAQENFSLAYFHANESLNNTEQHGAMFPLAVEQFLLVWACIGLKDYQKAKRSLQQAVHTGRRIGSHLFEWMGLLAQAQLAFEQRDETAGRRVLKAALTLGREQGLSNCFLWQPKVMARLCEKAVQWELEPEYVQQIIQKRNLALSAPSADREDWPWRLKIYVLGSFRIEKDGKQLAKTGKAPQRLIALLKALIACGGRHVKETQLTDALWPDAEGDAAHKSFSVTLTRLRALLGVEGALELSGGSLSLNPQYCWVDTWAFEELLKGVPEQTIDGRPKKLSAEAAKKLECALKLYKGPFLGEAPEEAWALPLHNRLHALYDNITAGRGCSMS